MLVKGILEAVSQTNLTEQSGEESKCDSLSTSTASGQRQVRKRGVTFPQFVSRHRPVSKSSDGANSCPVLHFPFLLVPVSDSVDGEVVLFFDADQDGVEALALPAQERFFLVSPLVQIISFWLYE